MPLGDLLDGDTEGIIYEVHNQHPDWIGKQVMDEVHRRLGPKRSKDSTWPGLRTIQKEIRRIKTELGTSFREDAPWSVVTLAKYEIPAEALPAVLRTWLHGLLKSPSESPLSIREARWVARLYKTVPHDPNDYEGYSELWRAAKSYAALERRNLATRGDQLTKTLRKHGWIKKWGFEKDIELYARFERRGVHLSEEYLKEQLMTPEILGKLGIQEPSWTKKGKRINEI